MPKSPNVPTHGFFKKMQSSLYFEYSKLEKAYNTYDASSAHRHDYYEVLIFSESGGNHEVDFLSYPVRKNTIHFISPGQVHLLRREKNVTGHVIAFKKEFFLDNLSFFESLPFFSYHASAVTEIGDSKAWNKIKSIIANLVEEYTETHPYKSATMNALLVMLLIEALKAYTPESGQNKKTVHEITKRFRKMVDDKFLSYRTVASYASKLNVTAGHLNDTVKADTGKHASEIIHERLLLEAKRLLYHSSKSIKEISSFLNYEDPSYFNRFFKLHTGSTPLEFRRQIREEYD